MNVEPLITAGIQPNRWCVAISTYLSIHHTDRTGLVGSLRDGVE